jgi:hypothetical protein
MSVVAGVIAFGFLWLVLSACLRSPKSGRKPMDLERLERTGNLWL